MKKYPHILLILAGLFLMPGLSIAQAWSSSNGSKQVVVGVQDAYFLKTGNNKTSSQFVVSGLFPNSCYSVGELKVDHESEFSHNVRFYANVLQGVCMMVLVPYTFEGSLGNLSSGSHSVKFISGDGTAFVKTLFIE